MSTDRYEQARMNAMDAAARELLAEPLATGYSEEYSDRLAILTGSVGELVPALNVVPELESHPRTTLEEVRSLRGLLFNRGLHPQLEQLKEYYNDEPFVAGVMDRVQDTRERVKERDSSLDGVQLDSNVYGHLRQAYLEAISAADTGDQYVDSTPLRAELALLDMFAESGIDGRFPF